MTSKHIINCPCCFKVFKKTACYEKHIFTCERTNTDKAVVVPNQQQLYDLIQNITEKYNLLQTELETIKSNLNLKNKKLNVLTWLNENERNHNNIEFTIIIKAVKIDGSALNLIFEKGFVDGVFEIINNHFQLHHENLFLKCFQQKKNTIHIFHDNEWQVLSNEDFTKLLNEINMKIFAAFNEYRETNADKLKQDEFQTTFNNNFQKILCVNIPFASRCIRIKNKLFTEFNECFKTMIEFTLE